MGIMKKNMETKTRAQPKESESPCLGGAVMSNSRSSSLQGFGYKASVTSQVEVGSPQKP